MTRVAPSLLPWQRTCLCTTFTPHSRNDTPSTASVTTTVAPRCLRDSVRFDRRSSLTLCRISEFGQRKPQSPLIAVVPPAHETGRVSGHVGRADGMTLLPAHCNPPP